MLVLAIVFAILAFSPIGRAVAGAINHRGAAGASPELRDAMDELAARVEALQRQVGELAERQDFTERLLAKVREKGLPPGGGTP